MNARAVKIPGPDHPITIAPTPGRVTVRVGGKTIASSDHALTLREANYGPVHYIPRADVDMALLESTEHTTYCPYKGECSYYSIPVGGEKSTNAVWVYEEPYESVASIRDHVAFYPDRVDFIEVVPVEGLGA